MKPDFQLSASSSFFIFANFISDISPMLKYYSGQGVRMSIVYIITDLFSKEEIEVFSTECDFYRKILEDTDLSELGAAIDIFEDSQLCESDLARYDPKSYFSERWRNYYPGPKNSEKMRYFLSTKLPSIICGIYSCERLHIFNESYIVKDSNSQIAFRWHTDSDEQLGAILPKFRPDYFSAWCPLDDTNIDNGTLAFPTGTKFISLKNNCADSDSFSPECRTDIPSVIPILIPSALHEIPTEKELGLSVEVKAGSVVLFSSNTWHRSGDNTTDLSRRVLYVQYSPCPIIATSEPFTESSCKNNSLKEDVLLSRNSFKVDLNGENSLKIHDGHIDTDVFTENPHQNLKDDPVEYFSSSQHVPDPSSKKKAHQEYPLCFAIPCNPIIPAYISSSEIFMKCCPLGVLDNNLSSATFERAMNPVGSSNENKRKHPKKSKNAII